MYATILFTTPGPYRRDLLIFLASVPELDVTATVETAAELAAAVTVPTATAKLLILDYALLATAVPLINAGLPGLRCLVLGETFPQLQQALAAGADCALLRGFSAAEFFIALRSLPPATSFSSRTPAAIETAVKPTLQENQK